MRKAVSIDDFQKEAERKLPPFLLEFLRGGSFYESTLRANSSDLENVELRARVLRDVSGIDLSAKIGDEEFGLPVALAPVGLAGLFARRGEKQAAVAASKANVPFVLSTVSICSIEEVATASDRPIWFQLYMLKDRGFMRDLLQKGKALGCSKLVFTVDLPVAGIRYRDAHSGLSGAASFAGSLRRFGQAMLHPYWAYDVGLMGRPRTLGNVSDSLGGQSGLADFFAWLASNFEPGLVWNDLEFIRSEWDGPIVLKGIMDVEDARIAAEAGVEGIVVSNHGGRQLDGAPSTAKVLSSIAEAVGGKLDIYADGGVRSGLDVVRMLALGADAVLLGRAWAFALAAHGESGVARMFEILRDEMRVAMALTGARSPKDIDASIIYKASAGSAEA